MLVVGTSYEYEYRGTSRTERPPINSGKAGSTLGELLSTVNSYNYAAWYSIRV